MQEQGLKKGVLMLAFAFISIIIINVAGSPVTIKKTNILPYSTDTFNNLYDFMDVYKWSHENDTINALGKVIIDYNMTEIVNLGLNHKHFDLKLNEILIETMVWNET